MALNWIKWLGSRFTVTQNASAIESYSMSQIDVFKNDSDYIGILDFM